MINCFKDPLHVLMTVLLSTNDDDDGHEEAVVDDHRNDVREDSKVDAKEDECQVVCPTLTLTSSLRKVDSNKKEKKKVQWVDLMGIKELAEIREFEPSGEDDIDSDGEKNCVCVIL
ncbi:hypothetical protein Bca4012_008343 [Brassica carinata]|uniref:Uncharacterized protein n=1 Tax=Brassica carinata TaxID=52824 RepID=A0A8X7RN63_BRACI|nr:hypothetical protein Bca52824_038997 [Brassica carinata]